MSKTTYFSDTNNLIFLNHKNIAQSMGDIDSNSVKYNAIPSLSLFNDTYDILSSKDAEISLSVGTLSNEVI